MSTSLKYVCMLLFALLSSAVMSGQLPYNINFIPTSSPSSVLYDSVNHHFYAAVGSENTVYVISDTGSMVLAKIAIPSAFGLDISPDGSKVYVTSSPSYLGQQSAQGYFVVDPKSFTVTDFVQPVTNAPVTSGYATTSLRNRPRFIAALSNGKVAYVAEESNVTGGALLLNDPATLLANPLQATNFYDGVMTKSLDGSTFAAVSADSAGDWIYVYDAVSNTFPAALRFTSTNSSDVCVSPDGSRVLVGGRYLFDRSLRLVATLPIAANQSGSYGTTFSPDGSLIYNLTSFGAKPVVAVYSAMSQQFLGFVPVPTAVGGVGVNAVAATNSGQLLVLGASGLIAINAATPLNTLNSQLSQSISSVTPNATVSGSTPPAATVNGTGFRAGITVAFGQTPASSSTLVSASTISTHPPLGTQGVTFVAATFDDGWATLTPNAYSYGPVIASQDITAGTSTGGTTVTLTGWGLGTSTVYPTVTVGGVAASVSSLSTAASSLQTLVFVTPAGSVGVSDIQVASSFGTTVSKGAFQYLSTHLISAAKPYQMIVDDLRNQLYVADYTSGSVLAVDGSTFAVRTLFTPASGAPTALALTPDKSTLLIASYSGQTLDLVDLASGKYLKTIIPVPGNVRSTYLPLVLAATARGTALVTAVESASHVYGAIYEVNLATGATIPLSLSFADSFTLSPTNLLVASNDGTTIYTTPNGGNGSSGGTLRQWQTSTDGITQAVDYSGSSVQLSTDDSGDLLLQDSVLFDAKLRPISLLASNSPFLSSRSIVLGQKMHASGALEYQPTTKGVELYDLRHGQLALSLATTAASLAGQNNLAVNHTGDRLFVAQANGIGIYDIPVLPLAIGALTPASGNSVGGTVVILRGSGFTPATQVTFDGKSAIVQYIDPTQLRVTTPAITAAKDTVTVTNPGGSSYSYQAGFDASGQVFSNRPLLTSVSPANISTGTGGAFVINGSGFDSSSTVSLNGLPLATSFLNSNQLTGYIASLPGPGLQAVTVRNADSNSTSNTIYINSYNNYPQLFSLIPSSINAGSQSFTLTTYGRYSLVPTTVLLWNGVALPTTVLSSSYLQVQVPASFITTSGSASITLLTPGQPASNAVPFVINANTSSAIITPATYNFGPVLLGSSASSTFILSSTGTLPLTFTGFSLSDAVNFTQTSTCPAIIAPAQTCTVTVTFKPNSTTLMTGNVTATLSLLSSATTAPVSALSATAGDFALKSTNLVPTVVAGQNITQSITLVTSGSVPASSVQFTCSGLPAYSTCTFSPASLSLTSGASTTLVITTSAGTRSALNPLLDSHTLIFLGGCFFCLFSTGRRNPAKAASVRFLALCVCSLATGGCGGGATATAPVSTLSGNTPAGVYSVTVTATGTGNVGRSTVLTLTVN